jgi:betaine reductase
MSSQIKMIHYLNQFFGGIGGEDKANMKPIIRDGFIGPGIAFQNSLKDNGNIVATVICGDNYYAENIGETNRRIIKLITPYAPDAVIAGPAFNAGRYGISCGAFCKVVQEKLHIPAVTGMYEDNPGTDIYRSNVYIIKTLDSARGMSDAIVKMTNLILKIHNGQEIGFPSEEGYIPRGLLTEVFSEKIGAERAIEMLINKISGKPFTSELHAPKYEVVKPAPLLMKLKKAKVALVTDGGLVPRGNPDQIESIGAVKYGRYGIEGLDKLSSGEYEVAHLGYAPDFIINNPNRLVPLDAMRELEKEGIIGKLDKWYYTTAGVGASIDSAKKIAYGIIKQLKLDKVNAVILTST